MILHEELKKGEAAFKIPMSCMLTTATALRTPDLGELLKDERMHLKDLPTVLLAFHLMLEHARCLEVECRDAALIVPVTVEEAAVPASHAPHAAGEVCGDDTHEHSHTAHAEAGATAHGHSHGGKPCHGHGAETETAPAAHGHSHGGKPCHGHGATPEPAAHGHSHGGKPCHGHGASDSSAGKPLTPMKMDTSHPWGSRFRAYLAMLPEKPTSCLYFSAAQVKKLAGT